jgi:hypothetical protein
MQGDLFNDSGWTTPVAIASLLERDHYLGPTRRGFAWFDEQGALVFASPTSRRLPTNWLELTRWCLSGGTRNGGSIQWARVAHALKERTPATTVVSYSDPSANHTGALYRACNWSWAPTWHRIKPPPSGNGDWGTGSQSIKDRWVFELRPDPLRQQLLELAQPYDGPGYGYREPRWKRGRRTPYVNGHRLFRSANG